MAETKPKPKPIKEEVKISPVEGELRKRLIQEGEDPEKAKDLKPLNDVIERETGPTLNE